MLYTRRLVKLQDGDSASPDSGQTDDLRPIQCEMLAPVITARIE